MQTSFSQIFPAFFIDANLIAGYVVMVICLNPIFTVDTLYYLSPMMCEISDAPNFVNLTLVQLVIYFIDVVLRN